MKNEFTIFGSGISAKITSAILARNGFKICLISDRDKNQKVLDTNLVTFLSSGSLNYLLTEMPRAGLFDEYPEIKIIKCHLDSLSKKKHQSVQFNHRDNQILGKIIKNTDLDKFLDKEINQLNNINLINTNKPINIKNTQGGVELKLPSGENIETDLFILSSAKKNIADQIKINFIKKDLEQEALSIDIKGEIKNKHCAYQKFTSNGPIALLPYSNDEASVVWSIKNNSKILLKDNKEITQSIAKHLNEYVGSIQIKNIEKHKLQFIYAKNLFYKNTLLIGNVAHNIHPIAGQGLNLSIKDIAALVKQVTKYRNLGYKINNQMILKEYEISRKLDNAAYSFGTFSLNGILSSNNKITNFITSKGLGLVEKSERFKEIFIKSATGKDFFKSF